jgi:hypothetical protein
MAMGAQGIGKVSFALFLPVRLSKSSFVVTLDYGEPTID